MTLLSEFTKSYNRVELLLLVYQKHTIVGKCTVFVRKNHACKHFIWEVFELIFKSLMFDWRRLIGNLANLFWNSQRHVWDYLDLFLWRNIWALFLYYVLNWKPKYYWHTCRALTSRGVSRRGKTFSFSRRHVNSSPFKAARTEMQRHTTIYQSAERPLYGSPMT